LRQVWEYSVTAGDITNGYVVLANDAVPTAGAGQAASYGPALYTNDSQDGILLSKARPPSCATSAYYRNVAWFGNVSDKLKIQTVSILGLSGWSAGVGTETSFTIGSVTVKASTFEDLPNRKFHLDTTSGSTSQKLFNTARSIARAMSWNNPNNACFFVSSANDLTPTLEFTTVVLGDHTNVGLTAANLPAGTVTPDISVGGTILATQSKSHYVYYSRPNEPEAVPDQSFVAVGTPGESVYALCTLRDSLFVFKSDGLYRITGSTANDIRVELFDQTVRMSSGQVQSVASAGNQVFAVTNQGVVAVTESGCSIISGAISDIIQPWTQTSLSFSVGIGGPYSITAWASDLERKYFLLLSDPANSSTSGYASQRLLEYNFVNQAWTEQTPPSRCSGGCVYIDDPFGNAKEKIAINSVTSFTQYTLASTGFTAAPTWSYCVEDLDDPSVLSRFSDVSLVLTGSTFSGAMTATFTSDSNATPVTVTQTPTTTNLGVTFVRFQVPREHAMAGQLNITFAGPSSGTSFKCSCVVVTYEPQSDRVARQ
jgi:hypothetical protein